MDGISILCINNFYYEMSQNKNLLQSVTEKVSRISKQWLRSMRKGYYKVWEVLKSVTIIKKWDETSFWYKLIQSQLQETSNSLTIYHEIYDRQINIIFYSMLGLRVEGWGLRGAWARR